MSNAMLANEWLSKCSVATEAGCADGTGLMAIHRKVFGTGDTLKREEIIENLSGFYARDENIVRIHNGLGEVQKAFVSAVARNGGEEYLPAIQVLADEFGMGFEHGRGRPLVEYANSYSHYRRQLVFLDLIKQAWPNTDVTMLFPGGKAMPGFVVEALREVAVPLARPYAPFEPSPNDLAICRENRIGDFAALVRFAGSEALKVSEDTFDITKARMARMVGAIGFPEACDGGGKFVTPREASRVNDFKVAMPMFALAATVGLLDIAKDGTVKPGPKVAELLSGPSNVFAKKLYESYCAKNRIYESHYIPYLAVRDGESRVDWEQIRRPVIGMLQGCPVGEWVDIKGFKRNLLLTCGNFIRRSLDSEFFFQGPKLRGRGQDPKWEECEGQIVETILSFLGAIGVADIAYAQHVRRFLPEAGEVSGNAGPDMTGIDFRIGISGFRVTIMGASILKMSDDRLQPETQGKVRETGGGLTVQPDFSVVIAGVESRLAHEPYLSAFLGRVSLDENVSIYRIDFESIVRAYRLGIMPKDIAAYLSKACTHPLADNVLRSFEDWQGKVGRVRIRTVTLMETDDPFLLGELSHTKGIDRFVGEAISHAVVITEADAAGSIRAVAEKSGWLVDLEGESNRTGK